MKNWFLALVVTIFLGGCSTLEVQVDYEPEYDFSSLSSFAVVYTKKNDERDFTRSRISNILNRYMQNKGYTSVDKSDADFYITLHLNIQKKSEVETNYESMGIRPSIYPYFQIGEHMGVHSMIGIEPDVRVTTNTYEYEEGMLILEVYDVKKSAVFWQGIAKDELSTEYTQEKKSAYLNSINEKLLGDFPSKAD